MAQKTRVPTCAVGATEQEGPASATTTPAIWQRACGRRIDSRLLRGLFLEWQLATQNLLDAVGHHRRPFHLPLPPFLEISCMYLGGVLDVRSEEHTSELQSLRH